MIKLACLVSYVPRRFGNGNNLQKDVKGPGLENELEWDEQDEAGYKTESRHHFSVNEPAVHRSISPVDTVQSPADDARHNGGAAKLEESKDDIRDS